MKNTWNVILKSFVRMNYSERMIWLSKLLYVTSMMARITYDAGTEKVNQPELLRRYNELLHRISSQQLNIAKNNLNRMPDEVFFEMVAEEVTYLGISDSVIKQLSS